MWNGTPCAPTGGMSAPLQPGDVVRIRGQRWTVVRYVGHGACGIIDARHHDGGRSVERARFIVPAEPVERLPMIARPRVVRPARWRRAARAALGAATAMPTSLLTAARAAFEVLPFQLEPALAVTTGVACRVLIADEVGLGKTIQAAAIVSELLERARDGHALIVTPAALREQWRHELERWFRLQAAVIDAAALTRTSAASVPENPWAAHPLVITSIDFIKRPEVLRSLEPLVWDVIVFDEAHALAGRSDRADAAEALGTRARHVVLLTATPHAGDDAAFQRLCGIGAMGGAFPCVLFRRTRQDAGLPVSRRTTWLRIAPTEAERRMHDALTEYARTVWRQSESPSPRLAMSVLARRAASSAASLATSLARRRALLSDDAEPLSQLGLPFPGAAADDVSDGILAAPGLRNRPRERAWLARLVALAESAATDESKVRALRRLLRRSRVPALVFTEYRDTLEHVSAALGGTAEHLHGSMSSTEREHATARFTTGNAVLMLATDAASEGLNLQARCHLVVNLELPWSPVRLEQRIGRVDRIGQRSRVHAINLVAATTIEEQIVERLLRRADRARAALTEMDIARGVLGDFESASPAASAGQMPGTSESSGVRRSASSASSRPGIFGPPPQVSALAANEAHRIRTARGLLHGVAEHLLPDRPLIANLSKRGRPRRCCLAIRIRFVTGQDDVCWETLFGIDAITSVLPGGSEEPGRLTASEVRQALGTTPAIEQAIAQAVDRLSNAARQSVAPVLTLAEARERSLADLSERRGARMAATLAQGSLFDRRHERAAAAQRAIAAEVALRTQNQLEIIGAMHSLSPRRHELVFAVLL